MAPSCSLLLPRSMRLSWRACSWCSRSCVATTSVVAGVSGGRESRPPHRARLSGDVDLDLLGFGLRDFCQVHCEHAVFEVGADLSWAGIIREREAAPETAVGSFDAVILFVLLRLLEFAFAHDGQRAV